MDADRLDQLIDRADVDELIRVVQEQSGEEQWEHVLQLRDRCRAAAATGRQLWPVASLAEYRLALDAPGRWAGAVLVDGAGPFALGPLTEVVAVRHGWEELAPHLPAAPAASFVAHERVLRGEDLRTNGEVDAGGLDLPLALQPWEPSYALAEYHADRAEFPAPPWPRLQQATLPPPGEPVGDPEAVVALRELVTPWTTGSNGKADVVVVEGDHTTAIAALGHRRVRLASIGTDDALAWMAWAGASGGAHGRRRGAANGRFGAWWAAAAIAGVLDLWPMTPDELGDELTALQWYAWATDDAATGWQLRLAVWDPAEDLGFAIDASDHA